MGIDNGHQNFFKIDKFRGSEYMDGSGDTCSQSIVGTTEGVVYNQFLDKKVPVKYWRKNVCRIMDLEFREEVVKFGVNAYKYVVPNNSLDRSDNESDCYTATPPLANGLADASRCYFGKRTKGLGDPESKNFFRFHQTVA